MWDALEAMTEVEQHTLLSATLLARRRPGFIECTFTMLTSVYTCACARTCPGVQNLKMSKLDN